MRKLLAACVLAVLAACASTPPQPSFNDQIAAGYALVQTVATEADLLSTTGVIQKADADKIEQGAAAAKAVLDVANAVHAANAADGGAQVVTAILALNQLGVSLAALQAQK